MADLPFPESAAHLRALTAEGSSEGAEASTVPSRRSSLQGSRIWRAAGCFLFDRGAARPAHERSVEYLEGSRSVRGCRSYKLEDLTLKGVVGGGCQPDHEPYRCRGDRPVPPEVSIGGALRAQTGTRWSVAMQVDLGIRRELRLSSRPAAGGFLRDDLPVCRSSSSVCRPERAAQNESTRLASSA